MAQCVSEDYAIVFADQINGGGKSPARMCSSSRLVISVLLFVSCAVDIKLLGMP